MTRRVVYHRRIEERIDLTPCVFEDALTDRRLWVSGFCLPSTGLDPRVPSVVSRNHCPSTIRIAFLPPAPRLGELISRCHHRAKGMAPSASSVYRISLPHRYCFHRAEHRHELLRIIDWLAPSQNSTAPVIF